MYPYLSKYEWLAVADELLRHQAPDVVDLCVRFFLAESRGVSDGRIRALLARRFKHCQLGRTHRDQLVACIARRLTEGNFSEQFRISCAWPCTWTARPSWPPPPVAGMGARTSGSTRCGCWRTRRRRLTVLPAASSMVRRASRRQRRFRVTQP